jgi:DNA-binding MarR family transcriptional regulator
VTLLERLGRLHRSAERLLRRRIALRSGRPFQQFRALRAMRREAIHTQAALADRLLIDAAATSRLVDRLVADGLVRRSGGADRRCVCLELTPAAAAELAIMDEAVAWTERALLSHLDRDQAAFLATLLQSIDRDLAADVADAAGPIAAPPPAVSAKRTRRPRG